MQRYRPQGDSLESEAMRPDTPLIDQLRFLPHSMKGIQTPKRDDPSPEEIDAMTAAIRASWDQATEAKRRGGDLEPMEVERAETPEHLRIKEVYE